VAVAAAFLATIATGLFAGAALYITLVEHPARVGCGSALAVAEFGPSYRRAAVMQATLALVGASAGIVHWAAGGGVGWLVGSVLLGAVIPFTLLVIRPTNDRLLDPSLDDTSPEARTLLARWGRLHAVRTGLSLIAFASFLALLVRS
jgi:hypothetical protein